MCIVLFLHFRMYEFSFSVVKTNKVLGKKVHCCNTLTFLALKVRHNGCKCQATQLSRPSRIVVTEESGRGSWVRETHRSLQYSYMFCSICDHSYPFSTKVDQVPLCNQLSWPTAKEMTLSQESWFQSGTNTLLVQFLKNQTQHCLFPVIRWRINKRFSLFSLKQTVV